MTEMLQYFGMLFIWVVLSALATAILLVVFASIWIPMINRVVRYHEAK